VPASEALSRTETASDVPTEPWRAANEVIAFLPETDVHVLENVVSPAPRDIDVERGSYFIEDNQPSETIFTLTSAIVPVVTSKRVANDEAATREW
jgi:hypothetical protein